MKGNAYISHHQISYESKCVEFNVQFDIQYVILEQIHYMD